MSTVLPSGKLPTGDSAAILLRRYSFLAPADDWIETALIGMLWDYTQETAWYQVGALTPAEVAEIFTGIWETLGVDVATIGAIIPYAGGLLPSGWLPCDGRSLVRSDYTALFAAIGTVWGAVDGSHFNIPNLIGQVPLGQGSAASGTDYALGASGGTETVTLTSAQMPSHTHVDSGHSHPIALVDSLAFEPGELPVVAPEPPPLETYFTGNAQANLQNTGGGSEHENRQPYGVVNYAIIAQ